MEEVDFIVSEDVFLRPARDPKNPVILGLFNTTRWRHCAEGITIYNQEMEWMEEVILEQLQILKLAQYRQREARCVGQTTKKSKKVSSCKRDEHSSNINECRNDMFKNVSQRIETNGNADSTEMILFPSGQTKKHNRVLAELYEFEAARKQQNSIITRLTAHLLQSRKETDEMINEFFQLTERKQKSQIQLQHVSETLQSSTHSTTAEELVLVKQQVHALHQQLEKQNHLFLDYQKKEEELKTEVTLLQEKIKVYEIVTIDAS